MSDHRPGAVWAAAVLLALVCCGAAVAQGNGNNLCDAPGESPDVIVGDLTGPARHGVVGEITAFSLGTTSCNVGSCWLDWIENSNDHPVIAQNLFRLKQGTFEQIGQSWLKHGFTALNGNLCSGGGCLSGTPDHLGVNCSDPYSANLNGRQTRLGPKFEVNAHTGLFLWPYTDFGTEGNAIYKRLQVHNDDLDPALNSGALYFLEGQYVTADDALGGNQDNNASYRRAVVTGTPGSGLYDLAFDGSTQREAAAIESWPVEDPNVELATVDVPGDGRFFVGTLVTNLGGGSWRYEYALHNLNSHRSARSFEVPIPAGIAISNVGFHDVDYHSGEPFSGADWSAVVDTSGDPDVIRWSTQSFDVDENANALRWGTLYNFRFDADVPPAISDLTLGLFRPGSPTSMVLDGTGPLGGGSCGNTVCDNGENPCTCSFDCGTATSFELDCTDGIDDDCDALTDCQDADCCPEAQCSGVDNDGDQYDLCEDCNDADGQNWSTPGEALGLTLLPPDPSGGHLMSWLEPLEPGGAVNRYDVLRSSLASDFSAPDACLPDDDPFNLKSTDFDTPAAGSLWCYLVRAGNGCDPGAGPLGSRSDGQPRQGTVCP